MRYIILFALTLSSFSLAGCGSTFEGIQKDFGILSQTVSEKTKSLTTQVKAATSKNNGAKAPVRIGAAPQSLRGGCPPVTIDPQLDMIVEFYDVNKTSPKDEVSHIKLANAQSSCDIDSAFINMRIDLSFEAALGPKARRKKNDRPFFAYPYFIAVTDENNTQLAKEIFAASVTYAADQNNMTLVESITQRLPLNADGSTPYYKIHVGFQLTEDQLFYNASH